MGAHAEPPRYIVPSAARAWMYGELTPLVDGPILASRRRDTMTIEDLRAFFDEG
jgi:hypothetical protein